VARVDDDDGVGKAQERAEAEDEKWEGIHKTNDTEVKLVATSLKNTCGWAMSQSCHKMGLENKQ